MALPFLLAGPILRRVEPQRVAVWVALSRPAGVRLSVWAGLQIGIPAGVAHARMPVPVPALRCGSQLFLALATLDLTGLPDKTLQPGINYAYDLEFTEGAAAPQNLASLGLLGRVDRPGVPGVNHEPLGYMAGALPSFALPPAELTDLKLVYGSCRRPCNEHDDAMVWIDDLIERARGAAAVGQPPDASAQRAFALARPHQLFLGGDQIYADDVSPIHLHLCNRAGHELLSGVDGAALDRGERPTSLETLTITGVQRAVADPKRPRWPESLQLGFEPDTDPSALPPRPLPATLDRFPAGGRLDISQFDAQMSSVDGDSHLLGFGEFAAMHLSVWSNTLWGAERWPDLARLAEAPGPQGAPGNLPAGQARTINSQMDVALIDYLDSRLPDWNEDGRPGPQSKVGAGRQAAAATVRDTWTPAHGTAQDYLAQPKPLREFFDRLMKHLRGRILRTLAERLGLVNLCDCAAVRNLGAVAIAQLDRDRRDARQRGGPDAWRAGLDRAVANLGAGTTWVAFVEDALQAVRGPQDDPLTPAWARAVAAKWASEPAADEKKARSDAELSALTPDDLARELEALSVDHVWKIYRRLRSHQELLLRFERGLPKVRRALANVPTYMIFDDHDVTDDWNLNPIWCERVLKEETSLGRQLVRNALAAYVLFQDWGNDPQRYRSGTPANVLANAAALFGSAAAPVRPDGGATRALDGFFGLNKLPQPESVLDPNGRHAPVTAPMTFHFQVAGPKHRVVALDNRTRRSFTSRSGPPGNIALSEMAAQIPAPVAGDDRLLVVVAPLQVLAPSLFDEIIAPGAYRAFDLGAPTSRNAPGRGLHLMAGTNPDAIEGWALDPPTFEALLERLAAHRRVLLLSGDVHYSAATQMSYWKKGVAEPARFVQFTCSGFKNVMPVYITATDRTMGFAHEMIRSGIGGERLGWQAGAADAFVFPPGKSLTDVPQVLRKRIARAPSFLPTLGWPVDRFEAPSQFTTVKPTRRPDFSWRLKPVFDLRPDAQRPKMAGPRPYVGTPPTGDKLASAATSFAAYRQIAARHAGQFDRLGNSRQILFRANVAQVRFEQVAQATPTGTRSVLEAVHEIYTAVPDPDSPIPRERPEPRDLSNPTPLAYVVHRAALTPDPAEPRPEDLPLHPPLAALR